MTNGRYAVDTRPYGPEYYQFLRTLFCLSSGRPDNSRPLNDRENALAAANAQLLRYIYTESLTQMMLGLGPNPQDYLRHLKTLPNIGLLSHVPNILNPEIQRILKEKTMEVGIHLMNSLHQSLGTLLNHDCIPVGVEIDCVILHVCSNTTSS